MDDMRIVSFEISCTLSEYPEIYANIAAVRY